MVVDTTAQVETLLKKYEPGEEHRTESKTATADLNVDSNRILEGLVDAYGTSSFSPPSRLCMSDEPGTEARPGRTDVASKPKPDGMSHDTLSWEMIELGLDEPLPLQEILDDLYDLWPARTCFRLTCPRTQIYFAHIHPSVPMIHQYRFLAALSLSPNTRPPIALRYAMWTLAASITDRYQDLHEHFYARARKYAELVEMTGRGEKVTSSAYTQAWLLIGIYELKMMYFPRAWLSTGKAVRLVQMMGMHRLDGLSYDVKQILPPPRDWVEKEERRRTFWMTFCMDRYTTVGTGWPMVIEEEDVSLSSV